jgi:predicted neutral ceramidase superfamily lipid hydrolase
MFLYAQIAQVVIALSIFFVWIVRFDVVAAEFIEYGLPVMIRSLVGATKIALSTLLLAGLWYPSLVLVPALLMAGLMVCAQIAHLKVKHNIRKFLPSLALLILSLFVAGVYTGILPR